MNTFRSTHSSPSLLPSSPRDDLIMEGVATNVKLLLKLIEDYNHAPASGDDRKPKWVAGMLGILDDVKSRIEKSQMVASRKEAELRRCNTDLRRAPAALAPRDRRPMEPMAEENHKLRKELAASLTARKSLERMFSSLGKEKAMMASELAKKVHELDEMEELLNDMKAQNERLLEKVKACAAEHRGRKDGDSSQGNAVLKEKNKELSEQLLRSIEGYRALKRKFKDAQESNSRDRDRMVDIAGEASAGLAKIQELRRRIGREGQHGAAINVGEELSSLERILRCLRASAEDDGGPE